MWACKRKLKDHLNILPRLLKTPLSPSQSPVPKPTACSTIQKRHLFTRNLRVYLRKRIQQMKDRLYYQDRDIDKSLPLQKKPRSVITLKNIICRHGRRSIPLAHFESEVGMARKWNYMALVRACPRIFRLTHEPSQCLGFTAEANAMLDEEMRIRTEMEPIIVNKLRKLLMMSRNHKLELSKIKKIQENIGLPYDFETSIIPKYPRYFHLRKTRRTTVLALGEWDSSLAVTSRELGAHPTPVRYTKLNPAPQCGNFLGPYAFKMRFPEGMPVNKIRLRPLYDWQNTPFISPYAEPVGLRYNDVPTKKRFIAAIHELLSLTLEKRLVYSKIEMFRHDYRLPRKLFPILHRKQGIFYFSRPYLVFLTEAYEKGKLVEKCPLLKFYDRFLLLMEPPPKLQICSHRNNKRNTRDYFLRVLGGPKGA